MVKHFVAKYSSAGNKQGGEVYIRAENLVEAQDKFFEFLRGTPMYSHMWHLEVSLREIGEALL